MYRLAASRAVPSPAAHGVRLARPQPSSHVAPSRSAWTRESCKHLQQPLATVDPEVASIIKNEEQRQIKGLQLIASENFAPAAVMEAVGSVMANKYSEGYPGARYYGGNEFIDQNERLCQKRALETFRLKPEEWGVNVQALSGSPANFAVYNAVLQPHDRIMGLDLPSGGHLTHGFMNQARKRISATSVYFESMPYRVDPNTGVINYDELELLAGRYMPKLIIAGFSAYTRDYDYKRMRKIADASSSILMSDMAHISGLVAAGVTANPFEYSDIVTTTTHKTLRGPRGGLIFFRRGVKNVVKGQEVKYDFEDRINASVFPSLQGGPHNHTVAGISVALKLASTPQFKEYQELVLRNAQAMCKEFLRRGYKLVGNGTSNHLLLVDLRPQNLDGARAEQLFQKCRIFVNKNAVPGDTKPFVPSGLRLGSPACTTRGFQEKDFETTVGFIDRAIQITSRINKQGTNSQKLSEFMASLEKLGDDKEIVALAKDVEKFSESFPVPHP